MLVFQEVRAGDGIVGVTIGNVYVEGDHGLRQGAVVGSGEVHQDAATAICRDGLPVVGGGEVYGWGNVIGDGNELNVAEMAALCGSAVGIDQFANFVAVVGGDVAVQHGLIVRQAFVVGGFDVEVEGGAEVAVVVRIAGDV